MDETSPAQNTVIARVQSNEASVDDLVTVFHDPQDAFICSPVPLSFRQLSAMYIDSVPEAERHMLPTRLRERSRAERWVERRAVYQSKRMSARRDAIINAEAEVWAIFGLEFHSRRVRGMWERWETLTAYVQDKLDALERGEGVFSTALRDACRELADLEKSLMEVMPTLQIGAKAQEYWAAKTGGREELVSRIQQRMQIAAGQDTARRNFDLIAGGLDVVDAEPTGTDEP